MLTLIRQCSKQGVRRVVAGALAVTLLMGATGCKEDVHAEPESDVRHEEVERPEGTPLSGTGYVDVMSDHGRTLAVNLDTSEIRVTDDATGDAWYSNPQDREEDPVANGANKWQLSSQLMVTYHTETGQEIIKDNAFDAIRLEQFSVETVGDEVRVHYVIGEEAKSYYFPEAIAKEKYEAFFDGLDRKGQRLIKRRYTLYEPGKLKRSEKDELLAKYPGLAEQPFYILRDGIQAYILEDMSEIFRESGYTLEEKQADEAEAGIETVEQEVINVQVPMYYSLDDGDLIVRIPLREIAFDPRYPLTEMRVLEMFGAAGADESGYRFVPDGSGALIDNNNGKLSTTQYLAPVYGTDRGTRPGVQVGIPEQIALPVFGGTAGDLGFLGIIEEGSALASIRADIAGRTNNYNVVHPVFQILTDDKVDLREIAGNNVIMAYQQQVHDGDIKLRYRFLQGEEASYSGMAESYREYLRDRGVLRPIVDGEYPLQLELLAAVDRNKPVLGIPVNRVEELTSLDEARTILSDLHGAGIPAMDIRYSGWSNGGFRQVLPSSVSPMRQVGSQEAMQDLASQLEAWGYTFYPDLTFTYVHKNRLFDGFRASRDAARFLDREIVRYAEIQPSTMIQSTVRKPFWMLSPARGTERLQAVAEDLARTYRSGIAVRDLGRDLGADYRRDRPVDREDAMLRWQETLKASRERDQKVMVEYGNAYTLHAADVIVDMPSGSSGYQISDRSVPFLQMVLHGSADYALEAMNLSGRAEEMKLLSLEYGASPYFVLMDEDGSVLKNSQYSEYYSAEYGIWQHTMIESYRELYEVLNPLRAETIAEHEYLVPDVAKVRYSDGTEILVNRTDERFLDGAYEVGPMDYEVLKGGAS